METSNAIEVRGLNKSFPGSFYERPKQVLHDVSFHVRKSVTTGFIGVNGSGKTTSLKCILGFIFPQSGEVKIFGESNQHETVRKRLGYLPERPYLYEFLTAREFLKFHWEMTGGGDNFQLASDRVLERVNLKAAAERRIRTFSKGMMQRVGFAQALLRNPELLILDEPMSGLDPDGRFLIKEIIREEKKESRTIFFSTHFLSDVEELCEDLVVIDQGRVLYRGPTLDLLQGQSSRIRIVYQAPQATSPEQVICEQEDVIPTLTQLSNKKVRIMGISNEYIALEAAFKGLRGDKDSGS